MNEAIIGKALAALVPALLLDKQGNLLHANERARGLVQLGGSYDQTILSQVARRASRQRRNALSYG
jgi:hypothetical protein